MRSERYSRGEMSFVMVYKSISSLTINTDNRRNWKVTRVANTQRTLTDDDRGERIDFVGGKRTLRSSLPTNV